jgi:hypothetical protein
LDKAGEVIEQLAGVGDYELALFMDAKLDVPRRRAAI